MGIQFSMTKSPQDSGLNEHPTINAQIPVFFNGISRAQGLQKDSVVYLPVVYQEVGLDWAASLEREQILKHKQAS